MLDAVALVTALGRVSKKGWESNSICKIQIHEYEREQEFFTAGPCLVMDRHHTCDYLFMLVAVSLNASRKDCVY